MRSRARRQWRFHVPKNVSPAPLRTRATTPWRSSRAPIEALSNALCAAGMRHLRAVDHDARRKKSPKKNGRNDVIGPCFFTPSPRIGDSGTDNRGRQIATASAIKKNLTRPCSHAPKALGFFHKSAATAIRRAQKNKTADKLKLAAVFS
jgi:hypothetical protein